MNTAFADFLNGIAQSGPIGTIVQIGTGDVPAAMTTGAGAIVVALPKPLVPDALRGLAARDDRLTLLPVAIGTAAGTARLQMFNFAAMSSLSAPSPELQALFPGLAVTDQPEVEVMALDQLLQAAPEDPGRPDVLILDMPGSEALLIGALTGRAGAPRFGHVLLRAGAAPLYADTRAFADLAAMLETGGFRIVARDASDPDLPVAHFRLEPLTLRVGELQAALDSEKAARKAERDKARARARAMDEQVAALGSKLAAAEKASEGQARTHAREMRKLRDEIDALKAEAEHRAEHRVEHRAGHRERDDAGATPDRVAVQARAAGQARHEIARLQSDLARERALNESLRAEFRRIEAQMEILRDFIAPRPPAPASVGVAPAAAPPPARARRAAPAAKKR